MLGHTHTHARTRKTANQLTDTDLTFKWLPVIVIGSSTARVSWTSNLTIQSIVKDKTTMPIYNVKPNTLSTVISSHYQGQTATISNDYDANDKGVKIGQLQRSKELKESILHELVVNLPKGQTVDQEYVDFKTKKATPDEVHLYNTKRAIAPFKVRVNRSKGLIATPSSAFELKDKLDGKADTSISQFWS